MLLRLFKAATIVCAIAALVFGALIAGSRRHGVGADWLDMIDLSQSLASLPVLEERLSREASQAIGGGSGEAALERFRATSNALNAHRSRIESLTARLPSRFVELADSRALLALTADDLRRHIERIEQNLRDIEAAIAAGHAEASVFEPLIGGGAASVDALRVRLDRRESIGDEALAAAIRQLDYDLRANYFAAVERIDRFRFLLAGALAALLIALAGWRALVARMAPPGEPDRRNFQAATASTRFAYSSSIGFAAVMALLIAIGPSRAIPLSRPEVAEDHSGGIAATAPPPGAWPRFRGEGGQGVLPEADVPLKWGGPDGVNVLWRTGIPSGGSSSPIVWGSRVFLTGAWTDPDAPITEPPLKEVYCFDADTGELLWQSPVMPQGSPDEAPRVMEETGYAAPSAATDGQRVYAIFADGDLAALDADTGREVWSKALGIPENAYGHASSLTMAGNLLIVQFDRCDDDPRRPSALIAFDGATGREAWRTVRNTASSWASPIVMTAGGRKLVVSSTTPWLYANDARTGEVVWQARVLDGEIGPSPTWAGNVVYSVNTGAALAAVRADGQGDVTGTHVLWKIDDETLPDVCTPVTDGRLLFTIDSFSALKCYDAQTGQRRWSEQLEGFYRASPVIAGDRLYVFDEDGAALVYATADEPRLLAHNRLFGNGLQEDGDPEEDDDVEENGEPELVRATPAFSNGRIYIRTTKALYCIGFHDSNAHDTP